MKTINKIIMVKGGVFFFGSIIFMTIVTTPHAYCLEERIKKFASNTNGFGTYSFEHRHCLDSSTQNIHSKPTSNEQTADQTHLDEDSLVESKQSTNNNNRQNNTYETTGGTYRREDGGIVSQPDGDSLVVRGEYGYIDPGGKLFSIKYVADSHGFHPLIDENDVRFNDRRII